jgi:putative Holliday junction resolvase
MAANIVDIRDIPGLLGPRERVLGLDLGEKTIGLALSDSAFTLASPLETIQRRKFTPDSEALKAVIAERKVGALVLGLPVNMDGSEGKRCQQTRTFADNLKDVAGLELPIAFWDERLSTSAVERHAARGKPLERRQAPQVGDEGVQVALLHVGVVVDAHGRQQVAAVGAHAGPDHRLDLLVAPVAEIRRRDVRRDRFTPGAGEDEAARARFVHPVGLAMFPRR